MANIKEGGHFTLTFTFDDQDPELKFFNGTYDGTNQNVHIGANSANPGTEENFHHGYYDIDWTNESNLANYFVNSPDVISNQKFNDDRDFIRKDYSVYNTNYFENIKDSTKTDVNILNDKEHLDHRLTTGLQGGYSQVDDINPGTGTMRNKTLLHENFTRSSINSINKTFINELSPYLIAVRSPQNKGDEYYCDKNDPTSGYNFAWLNGATMWTFPTGQDQASGVDVTKHVFTKADHPQHINTHRYRSSCYTDWQWGTEARGKGTGHYLLPNAEVTWLGSACSPQYDTALPDKPIVIEKLTRTEGDNIISPDKQSGPIHGLSENGLMSSSASVGNAAKERFGQNQSISSSTGVKDYGATTWGTRKAKITVSFDSKMVSSNYAQITPTATTIANLKVTVFIHYFKNHKYAPMDYSQYEQQTISEGGIVGTKYPNGNTFDSNNDKTDDTWSSNASWSGNTNTLIKNYRFRSIARFIELGTVPFSHMAQSLMSTTGKILLKEFIDEKNNLNIDIDTKANYKKGLIIREKNPSENEIHAEILAHAELSKTNWPNNTITQVNAYKGDSEALVFKPKDLKENWYIQCHDICKEDNGKRFNRLYFKFDEDGIYPRYNIHSIDLRGDEKSIKNTQTRKDIPYGAVAYIKSDLTDNASDNVGNDKGSSISALLNFTGQHRALSNLVDDDPIVGQIVVSCGKISRYENGKKIKGKDAIHINESVPEVDYSNEEKQKSVFGVISGVEEKNDYREYEQGAFVTIFKKSIKDQRLIVNSLGEGGIWICNVNGTLSNGDFITTSNIEGIGMKQDDDMVHNYTVAKITIDCNFTLNSPMYECYEFEIDDQKYRKAFVSCSYHCG